MEVDQANMGALADRKTPMARFTAELARQGSQPIVVLDDGAGRRVRIACRGATVLGYEIPWRGGTFDIAAGYRDEAELASHAGSRFATMVPFGGRIGDARYVFDGQSQDLQPGVEGAARGSRHGFVRDTDFVVTERSADARSARAVLSTTAIRPRPGYPYAIDLAVHFELDDAGLALEARMRNVGEQAAPCFFGWHPYFRVADGAVDGWELQIPARTLIRTDAELIPLPGPAAYAAVDDAPALDYRKPRLIGGSVIDQEYADLDADADGRIRTRLRDPASGLAVTVWQEHGLMHAFTGDTIIRDARRSVALEPMECMADAFRRPECAAAIRLEPGAERRFRCGVAVSAP